MPTASDRVVIEILTAANMAGIEQAKAGFLGMNVATLGLAAAFGIVVAGGKSMMDLAKQQEDAQKSLSEAVEVYNANLGRVAVNLDALQAQFKSWTRTNVQFISDQFDAEKALGAFVRAGHDAKESMRMLNDALDISVLRNISVADAGQQLNLVLAGNTRATRVFGITTAELSAIMKSHLTTAQKHDAILKLIEKHTTDGRKAQDSLKEATNSMGITWQSFATGPGKQLNDALAAGVGIGDLFLQLLMKMGKNNAIWDAIQSRFISMAKWVHDYILGPLGQIGEYISGAPLGTAPGIGHPTGRLSPRAAGGPVSAGGAYTVGEKGPETLVMGSQGGSIVPHGAGGNHVHLHIGTLIGADGPGMDRLAREILQRARFAPGM